MSKIFFADMDGTLLDDSRGIPAENQSAMELALSNGHIIAINTGRSIESAIKILKAYDLIKENLYLLSFQGNLIYYPIEDKVLYQDGFEKEKGIRLLNLLKSEGIYAQTYDNKQILSPGVCPELLEYVRISDETYRIIPDWEELPEEKLCKVISISYSDPSVLRAFRDKYEDDLKKDFEVFFSSDYYLEFTKRGIDKGTGVKKMAELLDIPLSDTVGIGDEENDIPMISCCGVGVAVANGVERAKEASDYITKLDNNRGAVSEAIKKFM